MKKYIKSAEGLTFEEKKHLAKTSTDPNELARLANDKNYLVRGHVARNQNTPIVVLEQLANDEDEWVRAEVAENQNTPVAILQQLANDRKGYVRLFVAGNPNTPANILAQLANTGDHTVRCNVAGNSSTPAEVLAQLANDENASVRQAVVKNPNTPADAIQHRSKSKSLQANNWQALIAELEEECEEYGDPLYEQTPAGEKLLELCYEVENAMHFYLEPSVQAGQGRIWIYDNETEETLVENIDYAEFNTDVIDRAFESNSADEFKRAYETYLLNIVE